ncbi:MAG: hypothetical protein C0494_16560 [Sphingobium sp.]|nr:hypothetical protein [Sphingobium sp.]
MPRCGKGGRDMAGWTARSAEHGVCTGKAHAGHRPPHPIQTAAMVAPLARIRGRRPGRWPRIWRR